MFIARRSIRTLSSVGAKCSLFRSYGAYENLRCMKGYKHFAPSGAIHLLDPNQLISAATSFGHSVNF